MCLSLSYAYGILPIDPIRVLHFNPTPQLLPCLTQIPKFYESSLSSIHTRISSMYFTTSLARSLTLQRPNTLTSSPFVLSLLLQNPPLFSDFSPTFSFSPDSLSPFLSLDFHQHSGGRPNPLRRLSVSEPQHNFPSPSSPRASRFERRIYRSLSMFPCNAFIESSRVIDKVVED